MNKTNSFFLFVFLAFFSLWAPSCAQQSKTGYYADNMGWSDKNRLINISEEMIQDAQLRIRQILDVRDEHSHLLAFDVGVVMGNIREKYRRMVETYREYRDKHSGRSQFFPPSFQWKFLPAYYIVAMQLVHVQEVEIDRLIHVLEVIEDEDLNPDPRYLHATTTRRQRGLREGDLKIVRQMAAEQELKSSYRMQHLMKRLHREGQQTTAKRFQRQWPVEGNWDLGAYGDMGQYGAGH